MAILKGIISKLNGSAGNLTFKQLGGKTVVSEKISSTTDAKTLPQQKQRMKWANVVRMYKVLRDYMKLAFGGSTNGRNDYAKFVSTNLALAPVYLTKQEVNAGACIVAPYAITQGILKSISVAGKGNQAVTSIALGSLTITADTTIAQFSNAVVTNNREFNYGDQITFFLVHQTINEVTNMPIADVEACAIVLDKNNSATLLPLVDDRGFAVQSGCLAAKAGYDFGDHGMAWVHSRKQAGKTLVSTQYLICDNALLTEYQSEAAYDMAAESYGGTNTVFLSPNSAASAALADGSANSGSTSGGSQTPSGGGSGSTSGGSQPGGSGSTSGSQTPSGGGSGSQGGSSDSGSDGDGGFE